MEYEEEGEGGDITLATFRSIGLWRAGLSGLKSS